MANNEAALRFGREMARARKQAGLTQYALGRALGVSTSHVSNLERGYRSPALMLLPQLDEALGTGERLTRLWDDLNGNGRPAWLDEISTAIQAADAVYEYQVLAWPGYLQTEGYSRALIQYGTPWLTPDEMDIRIAERMQRARHMAEAIRPKLWLVIDGTLLARRYGGRDVTREQLAYVADLAERERVTLQMVPPDAVRHPGNSGAFRVLTTRDSPDVVYVESAREGQSVTLPTEVAQRRMLFAALQGVATDPDTALAAVREEMKRLENE